MKKQLAFGHMAMAMMLSVASMSESMFDTHRHYTPTPEQKPKSFEQELESKGLHRYTINGEHIIAHNEREAQKRYNKRHKK